MESTTTASAPASAASARWRSSRGRLSSRLSEETTSATSTLAARTWATGRAVGRAPRDAAAARQHGGDLAADRVDGDPVADRRQVGLGGRGVAQAPRHAPAQRAAGGEQVDAAAVHGGDAGGLELGPLEGGELSGAPGVEAEAREG